MHTPTNIITCPCAHWLLQLLVSDQDVAAECATADTPGSQTHACKQDTMVEGSKQQHKVMHTQAKRCMVGGIQSEVLWLQHLSCPDRLL